VYFKCLRVSVSVFLCQWLTVEAKHESVIETHIHKHGDMKRGRVADTTTSCVRPCQGRDMRTGFSLNARTFLDIGDA